MKKETSKSNIKKVLKKKVPEAEPVGPIADKYKSVKGKPVKK